MESDIERKLRSFLNLFWLRPENALLCTFKSKVFEDVKFESPSIDISCADGLFAFIHFGGSIDHDFDYYQSTRAKEFTHDSFVDIYDSYQENYEVKITRKPNTTIDYGTDWKQALLNKSSKLNIYKNLLLYDNNKTPMPFPDNYFKTIHSNAVYWVRDVKRLLLEIHRILNPGGVAILEVMTPYHLETLEELSQYLSPRAISILDRKRRETMPTLLRFHEWEKLILECGFKIEETRSVYPNKLIIDLWNIGLRPISHLLIQMSSALSNEDRRRIKEEWVEIFFELFKPLLTSKQTYSLEKDPYPCFILRK